MADQTIKDSPISQLSAVVELSSNDLFLVSKEHREGNVQKFTSNKITFNDTVSSIIDYSSSTLSTYFQTKLSVFMGTVTLTEWTHVDA